MLDAPIALILGLAFLTTADLGKLASDYLSDRLGRKLTIASARLHIGNPVRIEISGVRLANMEGGSQPDMIALAHLTADVSPFRLLFGPQTVRHLSLEG